MNGHTAWQFISHYSYVLITVIGVVIVLALVYRDRQRKVSAYGQREVEHDGGEEQGHDQQGGEKNLKKGD